MAETARSRAVSGSSANGRTATRAAVANHNLAPCSDRSATGNGRRCGSRWVLSTGRYPKVLVEPASVRRFS
jgi:hypothetical protein